MSRPDRHEDAAEVLFLLSFGVPAEEALARVGWTPQGAHRWALRHQHRRLLAAVTNTASVYRREAAS